MARRRGSSDADKQNQERRVFLEFAKLSGLPVDPETIENRKPPEPDILCVVGGERIAFELAAICNPELAKDIGDQIKRGTKPKYQVLGDPSREAFLSKLKKAYETDAPIELVLYTGWTAVLDDLSIPALRDLANTQGTGPFRRVWYLGERCEVVAERKARKVAMVTISIQAEAYQAITGRPPDPSERDARGVYPLILDPKTLDRLMALRGSGESYSDVILRLAKA